MLTSILRRQQDILPESNEASTETTNYEQLGTDKNQEARRYSFE
jgi:hypothetical protein